ncbi:hypothetical protein [Streptomyces silvisoli]|uniref:hypothetical protein n=1 Tax=Streptomyces silvisoli TaxID=3034235 RepID=UPI0037038847
MPKPTHSGPGGASTVRRRAVIGAAVLVVISALTALLAYLTRDERRPPGGGSAAVVRHGRACGRGGVTSMSELVTTAANLAAKVVDSTTAVDLNASWFRDNYELLLPIGLILTVGTFCLALMRAAWRRDGDSLAQAVTGTMTGVFFALAVIGCTTVADQALVRDLLADWDLFVADHPDWSSCVRGVLGRLSSRLSTTSGAAARQRHLGRCSSCWRG